MRQFAIVVTFVEFVLSIILYYNFDINSADVQFMVNIPIIKSYGINYLIGVDGISFFNNHDYIYDHDCCYWTN